MARARNIKPGICLNDTLAGLPHWVRLLFIYSWTAADRAGRLRDNPRKLGAALFPYESNLAIDEGLQHLHDTGFLRRYAVAGERFIQVVNWAKHQSPHVKEAASDIPPEGSTEQALEKPMLASAQPEQAPEKPERAALIPDSGYRIPDSLNPANGTLAAHQQIPPLLQAEYERCLELHPNADPDTAGRAFVSMVGSGKITEADVPLMEPGMKKWLRSALWEEGQGRFSAVWRAYSAWLRECAWRSNPAPSKASKAEEAAEREGYWELPPEMVDASEDAA